MNTNIEIILNPEKIISRFKKLSENEKLNSIGSFTKTECYFLF